ncbi:hypothetical protein [Brevundimonas lenta]|uniref:Flp pilus assembly protein TadB n=1 Tax=Brevundimonas lenta TaxID=424796 RepID=A0A7W6NPE2_9CAUL|nr:hypothetical protein [Brevundimonas lenta]MBB4082803.1 Flp pilus assembly protein TadB [Brevundimonas lenta]
MDIGQHSVTLISIIIGLGLTEMLGNLHRLIRNRERVKWDPLPLAWVVALTLLVLNYWWAVFLGLDGSDRARTAAEMGLVLAPPLLLFVTTASVLPNFEADSDWDMRRHYAQQHKVFVLTFMVYQLSTWATALLTGGTGWNLPTVVRVVILALLALMLLLKGRIWDWIAVAIIIGLLALRLTTQLVR